MSNTTQRSSAASARNSNIRRTRASLFRNFETDPLNNPHHLGSYTVHHNQPQHHHSHQHHPILSARERPATQGGPANPAIHPQFRSKAVCTLFCKHCTSTLCNRGMKAILLGNIKVELYSTDVPPKGVQLVWNDYTTQNCHCRIRDAACLGCGNIVGYHVTQGCHSCLKSCHNGHFWMFHSDGVGSYERMDGTGMKPLKWANLPAAEQDKEKHEEKPRYDLCAR